MAEVTEQDVKAAARYLEDGGLGEVMHALHMTADMGQNIVQSETALIIALCAMAGQHIETRNPVKQPVRMNFGKPANG